MKIRFELRKIKREFFDDLYREVPSNIEKYLEQNENDFIYSGRTIEELSDPVILQGSNTFINIDISKELTMIENPKIQRHKIDFEMAKKLFVAFNRIPRNIMYDNRIWTYLSHTFFKEYIVKRYFLKDTLDLDSEEKSDSITNKIRRYFFSSTSKKGMTLRSTRIGLKFLYSLIELTYDDKEIYGLTEIALRFIDPVKAIYEREVGKNPTVIKAFIKAIQLNNLHSDLRSEKYRSLIPKHISNLASVNMLDAYNYHELSKLIAEEQIKILNLI